MTTSSLPFAVSRKKQVLNRPPEPKASPDPMIVRRIVKPMLCIPKTPSVLNYFLDGRFARHGLDGLFHEFRALDSQ